jgi:hypothetical protein
LGAEQGGAVLHGEAIQNRMGTLTRTKDHHGPFLTTINNRLRCSRRARNGDCLSIKVDVLKVSTGRDEHSISVGRGVYGTLNCRLITRDINRALSE